jgi:hypothetical protein
MTSFRDQFNFPMWNLMAWVIWAAGFAVLETLGVKYPTKYATLTYLCIHAVPAAILAAFCGWLGYHFLVQYAVSK